MAVLNSNPEILLRKRKNADRKRLEKQEQIRDKIAAAKKLKLQQKKKKFIRAETLLSNQKSNEIERKRIKNISKKLKKLNETESISEGGGKVKDQGDYKLLFLIRIPNHTKGLKIPKKAFQVLQVLKLTESNTGVFIKANSSTIKLLGLIAPYVIIGQPSILSIRKLFQKRARFKTIEQDEETKEDVEKVVKLDNNKVVEDKFEDDGMICIEDLIHEIVTMGPNFLKITGWLEPFKLNQPVHGWGPQAKLARLIYDNDHKVSISLAQDYKLQEVEDIDLVIDQQN
ncbi:ribosome biogenesis protein RLP7 [Lodderomyces elongisporus NRRL YB-4239]|uniref:Ribosome biogenesis protein RLP7 n=1 Tax=Lodderomyces elongisporus (strain ATCC 11503 / CBS 2605 / JCM 1781 / NBRC 1676 / NRRL YB-4239) TaxID=379508 RepID=A5E0R7_LODEL|nr:ribosome biogenesis protein RLP7 [Lodderomyces elongisporus NRRL YB-4239]